jgi:hypothetical protein
MLYQEKSGISEANRTTLIYNASVAKNYNATSSLARRIFVIKIIFLQNKNALAVK